jgi:MurNAc alpha-1-phosphate uridylyltransferase
MILAAGRGERMRPLTDHLPKPMLPAGGKPLIVWHVERLARSGFRELVVNHAWFGERIEEALGDGARFGVRIAYSREAPALETAGGIARALPLLAPGPFLVVNGDIYTEYEFSALLRRAGTEAPAALAHLVLVPNPPHHPLGDFVLRDGRVSDEGQDRLTFAGIGMYRPELFANLIPGARAQLAPLLRAAMAAGAVTGERFDGMWSDVGTPERLAELDQRLRLRAGDADALRS